MFKPAAYSCSAIIAIMQYLYPPLLLGSSTSAIFASFANFLTFFFHQLVVLYLVLSLFFGDYKPRLKDCINNIVCVSIYASYALPVAYTTGSNYVNILHGQVAFLENIRLAVGQVVYNIGLFVAGSFILCLITIAYYYLLKLVETIKEKRSNKKEKENAT